MSSDITYVRTMKLNYGKKLTDTDFAKLANQLQEKGITIGVGMWDNDLPNYGFNEVETKTKRYVITFNDDDIFTTKYRLDAVAAYDAFSPIVANLLLETRENTTTVKKWVEVEGVFTAIDFDIDGLQNEHWERDIIYISGARMRTVFTNSTEGLCLKFIITWKPKSIQRKDAIETTMVDEVLQDMASIQSVIEGRMKLKQFGVDIDAVEINCHFDAMTESRSECSPDIINRVREARSSEEE